MSDMDPPEFVLGKCPGIYALRAGGAPPQDHSVPLGTVFVYAPRSETVSNNFGSGPSLTPLPVGGGENATFQRQRVVSTGAILPISAV